MRIGWIWVVGSKSQVVWSACEESGSQEPGSQESGSQEPGSQESGSWVRESVARSACKVLGSEELVVNSITGIGRARSEQTFINGNYNQSRKIST